LHALLTAAFASNDDRGWSRAGAAGRDGFFAGHRHCVVRAGAISDPDSEADSHAFADPDAHAITEP
jgi:hypothetical protein